LDPTEEEVKIPTPPAPEPQPVVEEPAVEQPKARVGSQITYAGKYYYTIQPQLAGQPQGDYFAIDGSSYKPGDPVIVDRIYDNDSPQAKWWKG